MLSLFERRSHWAILPAGTWQFHGSPKRQLNIVPSAISIKVMLGPLILLGSNNERHGEDWIAMLAALGRNRCYSQHVGYPHSM